MRAIRVVRMIRPVSFGGAGTLYRAGYARRNGTQLRRTAFDGITTQCWLAEIFATTFSNLRMVGMPVPLRFSASTRRVGRRTQAESRVAGSKRFGRPSLQSLNNSIPEKPWLGLRDPRPADLCALIDVRGLLPRREIDIAGLQQTVILLERDDCALDFRAIDAVGLNRTTTCSTITIRRKGCLHVANPVACFPKSGYVVVKHRQGLDTVSKRSLNRKAAAGQVLNVVFILLEISGIHFEMGMNPFTLW